MLTDISISSLLSSEVPMCTNEFSAVISVEMFIGIVTEVSIRIFYRIILAANSSTGSHRRLHSQVSFMARKATMKSTFPKILQGLIHGANSKHSNPTSRQRKRWNAAFEEWVSIQCQMHGVVHPNACNPKRIESLPVDEKAEIEKDIEVFSRISWN